MTAEAANLGRWRSGLGGRPAAPGCSAATSAPSRRSSARATTPPPPLRAALDARRRARSDEHPAAGASGAARILFVDLATAPASAT